MIDYYIDELKEYDTQDFKISKFSVNTMIGAFKPRLRENWKSIAIVDNYDNAFYHYLKSETRDINCFNIDDKHYYHIYDKYLSSQEETEAPIYNMVLDLEAIELHKLSDIIKSKGGQVLDLCTDCVNCTFDGELPFDILGHEFEAGVPKYKVEEKPSRLKVEMMKNHIRTDVYNHKQKEWKIICDSKDSNDFDPFVQHILDNKLSINIDGLAGTGKSTLTKQIIQELDKRELKYAALATTNKAARVIKGMTIHRFVKRHTPKIIKSMELDYIIVDEISMMHEMFYHYLTVLKKVKPNLRFILIGDFNQLPPVNDRVKVEDYENGIALHDLCNSNRLKLSKCRRADDVTFKMVHPDNILNLKKTDFGNQYAMKHLAYTNATRIKINDKLMKKVAQQKSGKKPLKLAKLEFDSNSQSVQLLGGTPIIAHTNNDELEIFNNETYTIKEIQHAKNNIVIIDDEGNTKNIKPEEFQQLFYVAYCITIHKAQGATFDEPYTINEWDLLDKRLKYVALSRTTNKDYINVL
jgi:hypothetical protein